MVEENNIIENIKNEVNSNGKKVRIAINGFGRIGRMIFRVGFDNPNVEFVAINDPSPIENLAYLLKYDSAHGKFPYEVKADGDFLVVGDKRIRVTGERELKNLPWKELDINVVAECTGHFTDVEKAKGHITEAGAKKVLISAPGKGDCFYFVRGVNDSDYNGQLIVSNGSCTTNSMTAVVDRINKRFGIEKGLFSTVHSMTGDQRLVDGGHPKVRRGRAAPSNIVLTTTGAANSVIRLIPELKGKLHGIAYRVPTITGSITDMNLVLKTNTTAEEVNNYLRDLSENELFGIVEYTEEPLVSSDIIGNPHSGIVDGLTTEVIDGNLLKIAVWYDNEYGFSYRMIEVMIKMGRYE